MSKFPIPLQRERASGRPEVDLRMVGGRGYIRGPCSHEDDGRTFAEAADYLARLAELEGDVSWDILLELDRIVSTSVRPAMAFMDAMAKLVAGVSSDQRRSVVVRWRVPRNNASLVELARSFERLNGPGLQVTVDPSS